MNLFYVIFIDREALLEAIVIDSQQLQIPQYNYGLCQLH